MLRDRDLNDLNEGKDDEERGREEIDARPWQTLLPDRLSLLYEAEFDFYSLACCASPWLCLNSAANRCCLDNTRLYFYVLENGYEYNVPIPVFDFFFTLMVRDHIYRYYFDGGIFSHRSCCWRTYCIRGKTELFAGERKYVCMGQPCSPEGNRIVNCYWPRTCGERVRYVPADVVCFCFPTHSNEYYNCCGFCGPINGEPLCLFELVNSLKQGTSTRLAMELEDARSRWQTRHQSGGEVN